jgi:hypothetical protein
MEEKRLAQRMYFFVPYNISPIQQAIQAGHASLEYVRRFGLTPNLTSFIENDKTWIILNGGTTNASLDEAGQPLGTLNILHEELWQKGIYHAIFHEPDLNNALTAICFLADERVYDYKNYPDFFDFIVTVKMTPEAVAAMPSHNYNMLKRKSNDELQLLFPEWHPEWIESLGGNKNAYLRELLKGKKLA